MNRWIAATICAALGVGAAVTVSASDHEPPVGSWIDCVGGFTAADLGDVIRVTCDPILATTTTVEGEATAHYLADMAAGYQIKVTRIAHGVPLGGELEYVDSGTLAHAFAGRQNL